MVKCLRNHVSLRACRGVRRDDVTAELKVTRSAAITGEMMEMCQSLPLDCLISVFSLLQDEDLIRASTVCKVSDTEGGFVKKNLLIQMKHESIYYDCTVILDSLSLFLSLSLSLSLSLFFLSLSLSLSLSSLSL